MPIPAPSPAPEPGRFITAPMSTVLDLARGLSALAVLVFHAVQTGLYTGPFPDWPLAQHFAVVVFFVLSGLVIASSVDRRPQTLRDFALARASRILPVSLPALAFSTLAFVVATGLGAPALHADHYGVLTWQGALTPLLFLDQSPLGSGPVWNPPYWSLSYEVWYYALFGVATFLRGGKRLFWLAVLALLAGPRVLLLMPAWLVGVALARAGLARLADWRAGLVVAIVSAVLAVAHSALIQPGRLALADVAGPALGFSRFAVSDLALAVAVAGVLIGLRPLANRWPGAVERIARPARWLAGISFTLYLFHWPMLNLCRVIGINAGASALAFAGILLAIIALCDAIARVTEHQRHRVRALLDRVIGGKKAAPLAIRSPSP